MAAHQGLMSDCALQCDSQAKYKAIWQTVIMLQSCYIYGQLSVIPASIWTSSCFAESGRETNFMTVKPLVYIKVTEGYSGLIHAVMAEDDVVFGCVGH